MSIFLYRLLRVLAMVFIFFFMAGNGWCADTSTDLSVRLNDGNIAFTEGRYKEAVVIYSDLIHDFGFSPELLHNLANSYAADGQTGMAVLNYMRGLRIAPADDALRADLALIRKKVGLFSEKRSLPVRFFSYYNMNQWLKRALLGYVLLTLLLVFNSRFHPKKGIYSSSFVLTGVVVICCIGAYYQHKSWDSNVIIQPEARLLLSPFKAAASNGSLIEGTLVNSQKKHQDYYYVLDEKGRAGWIQSSSFEPINTSSLTYSLENAEQ